MPEITDIALRNAVLDRKKLMSRAQKVEYLESHNKEFVDVLRTLKILDEIDGYVAALLYLEMTDTYLEHEKINLRDVILRISNNRLTQVKNDNSQLYQKIMKDKFLSMFFSSVTKLPSITAGTENQEFIFVGTNEKMKMESAKVYGHNQYYQCVIALVTRVDGSQYFYHLNPNRLFGDYMGDPPLVLSDNELTGVKNITFILHPLSILSHDELKLLQKKGIPFDTISLPVGSLSVSIKYDTGNDRLIVNNIEGGQIVVYNNVLTPVKYDRYKITPEQFFLSQLNNGMTWAEALDSALEHYIATRKERTTWSDPRPLFLNKSTTKLNLIAAERIRGEIALGVTSFDFNSVTKNGLLNKLLTTALEYQSRYQQFMSTENSPVETLKR